MAVSRNLEDDVLKKIELAETRAFMDFAFKAFKNPSVIDKPAKRLYTKNLKGKQGREQYLKYRTIQGALIF
ncbi:hypothetical protein ACI6Q2_06955 [Chitinophagaceae bacterium LWZ2-11]